MSPVVFLGIYVGIPLCVLVGGFFFLFWESYRQQRFFYFLLAVLLLSGVGYKAFELFLVWRTPGLNTSVSPRAMAVTVLYLVLFALSCSLSQLGAGRTLEESRSRAGYFHDLWNASREAGLVVDPEDATIIDCNERATQLLQRTRDDIVGSDYEELDVEAGKERPWLERVRNLEAGTKLKREGSYRTGRDGSIPVEIQEKRFVLDGDHYIATSARDVSARKQYERELRSLTFRSQITGLPSRDALVDRIRTASERVKRRTDYRFALIGARINVKSDLSDVSGFDLEGRLLKQVAERIRNAIREMDELAHINDRVFAVLLEELKNPDDEMIVARRIHDQFETPFHLDDWTLDLEVTLGIRTVEAPGDSNDLLAEARQAMLEASKQSGEPYVRYRETEHHAFRDSTEATR